MSTTGKRKRPTATATPTTPASPNGRIFTDSDEIRLLKTLQKIIKATPSSSSLSLPNTIHSVDSPTFSRINSALDSKFTHAQIKRKIRSLRVKYRSQARSKSLIKTPHDQELFKIAQDIWGKKTRKETQKAQDVPSSDGEEEEEEEGETNEQAVERNEEPEREEGVNLEEYPVLISEFSKYFPMNVVWREALKSMGRGKLREMNEKWTMIGIEEARIVAKKADLVKEQTEMVMKVLGETTCNGNGNGLR